MATKKRVTNEDLYKKLVQIEKNTKKILRRLDHLHDHVLDLEEGHYDQEHLHEMPEYKA